MAVRVSSPHRAHLHVSDFILNRSERVYEQRRREPCFGTVTIEERKNDFSKCEEDVWLVPVFAINNLLPVLRLACPGGTDNADDYSALRPRVAVSARINRKENDPPQTFSVAVTCYLRRQKQAVDLIKPSSRIFVFLTDDGHNTSLGR